MRAAPVDPKTHKTHAPDNTFGASLLPSCFVEGTDSSSSKRNTFGLTNEKQKVALLKQKSINAKHGEKARDYDLDMKLKHLERT